MRTQAELNLYHAIAAEYLIEDIHFLSCERGLIKAETELQEFINWCENNKLFVYDIWLDMHSANSTHWDNVEELIKEIKENHLSKEEEK